MELIKQITWSRRGVKLYHFRTHAGKEVDFVLEDLAGKIVGIEVKTGKTVRGNAYSGLGALKEAAGKDFVRGILLHGGDSIIFAADDISAVPLQALWSW